jgi:hypothetical protein
MFLAAFTSACSAKPHDVQQNLAWFGRFFLLTCPQDEHVWEVYAGSTYTTGIPARTAL